ncbi:MAG: hypothetical protein N2050_06640 [Flavobacteriales bacterium]|nr:hypothetical protein [Flavobacteriales bacterium]
MHIRRLFIFTLTLFLATSSRPQDVFEVEARGVGLKREDALREALRNAVEQAVGVTLSSETRVENFMVISDAIATRTQGYIKSYDVVREAPFPDRFEVTVKAAVTTSPLKADFNLLARALGGVRFMVTYDPRQVPESERPMYDLAVEKINEFLAERKYRYIDRRRFETLQKEALKILESDASEISYVQWLGLNSGAQFIIHVARITADKRSEAFDTRTSTRALVEVHAFDNCTAEGLGTVVMESDRRSASDAASALRQGIGDAVGKGAGKLLSTFTEYIGRWVNEGTPYELRFYNVGTYRDFRDLRNKLKEISEFGGEMEIVAADNYTRLNCTYRKKPDELADKILDVADAIPAFREKQLDVKLIYGRQINFAPRQVRVPELEAAAQAAGGSSEDSKSKTAPPPQPSTSRTAEPARPTPSPTPSQRSTSAGTRTAVPQKSSSSKITNPSANPKK